MWGPRFNSQFSKTVTTNPGTLSGFPLLAGSWFILKSLFMSPKDTGAGAAMSTLSLDCGRRLQSGCLSAFIKASIRSWRLFKILWQLLQWPFMNKDPAPRLCFHFPLPLFLCSLPNYLWFRHTDLLSPHRPRTLFPSLVLYLLLTKRPAHSPTLGLGSAVTSSKGCLTASSQLLYLWHFKQWLSMDHYHSES